MADLQRATYTYGDVIISITENPRWGLWAVDISNVGMYREYQVDMTYYKTLDEVKKMLEVILFQFKNAF